MTPRFGRRRIECAAREMAWLVAGFVALAIAFVIWLIFWRK